MSPSSLEVARSKGLFFATACLLTLAACSSTERVVDPHAPAPGADHAAGHAPVHAGDEAGHDGAYMHALIPAPAAADFSHGGYFVLNEASQIVVDSDDPEALRVAHYLAELIGNSVETTPPVVRLGQEREGPHIQLILLEDAESGEEGYDLVIGSHGVALTAATAAGLFYGVQSIRQLLPAYVEYTAAYPQPLTLPIGRVTDAPRFAWRGAMLDVARHFFPVEAVTRYIDLMALYKLNRLHLHLSDDQGWRIEIPGRPRLTEIGAKTEVGGRAGGFYTAEDYAQIVSHAADHFITIVPEIDMPGHTNAALASYAELNCDGAAAEPYTGTEVGFSTLCVDGEETYAFVDDVVREIAALTPGAYFHLGGDEVHELTEEAYVRFMERAQEIVASHGKQVVGWDEIAEVDLSLIPGSVIQVWRPQSQGIGAAVADAVAAGARVVISPADRIYIDMKYDSSTVLGLAWAGYNDVRDAYDWEPAALIPGLPESAILGVEAPMWAESLAEIHEVEYMAFPRLAGVAELAWSTPENRSWESYRRRLGAQAPRWTALGVTFYRAPEVEWEDPRW